jgi:hypothetical protein
LTRKKPIAGGPFSHLALLDPATLNLSVFIIAASFVMPFTGFGIDLCALHAVTGLPCPGCGLTRAFIAASAGDLTVALGANPFVLVLYPLFAALAVLALLPDRHRSRAMAWLDARGAIIGKAYRVGLVAFVGFGALRFCAFAVMGERFP